MFLEKNNEEGQIKCFSQSWVGIKWSVSQTIWSSYTLLTQSMGPEQQRGHKLKAHEKHSVGSPRPGLLTHMAGLGRSEWCERGTCLGCKKKLKTNTVLEYKYIPIFRAVPPQRHPRADWRASAQQTRETMWKRLGNHESPLGAEGTIQDWRNCWASLFTFPLHLDSGQECYPGSLADLRATSAVPSHPSWS